MKSVLLIIRLLFYFSSIPLFILSLTSKNKNMLKVVKHSAIGSIIYLISDLLFFEHMFDINSGFGPIVVAIFTVPILILFFIMTVISGVRTKKVDVENNLKFRWTIVYILPAIIIAATLFFELAALDNAKLILINNPDGFSGDYYSVVVTQNRCIKVDLGEKFFNDHESVEYNQYYVYVDDDNELRINSYQDETLSEIDLELINKLCDFEGYKKRSEILSDDYRIVWTINKIVNTDYYHVTYLANSGNSNSGGAVIGEAMFFNDIFIDDIEIGDIGEILLMK